MDAKLSVYINLIFVKRKKEMKCMELK